jgi:hypothetical protein
MVMKSIDIRNHVYVHKDQMHQARDWCEQQWGKQWNALDNRDGLWSCFWGGQKHYTEYRFSFAHEQHAVFFALRWV